jgi:branched-chain amino acid transport system permease protein
MTSHSAMFRGAVNTSWRNAWPLASLALLVTGIVLIDAIVSSDVLTRMVMKMLINLVLVVGLYIFIGNSGVFSFGHMSFMAIGAYVGAILTIPIEQKRFLLPDLPGVLGRAEFSLFPAITIAAAFAMVIAVVVAIPLMRLNGIAAGIGTFAWLLIVRVVISNWDGVTRGTASMPGIPTDATPGKALLAALAAMTAAYLFQSSRSGLRLRASREDELAASAVGVNVVRERTIAFGLSAFFVAIGGVLFGHFVGIFSPDDFYLATTFIVVAMLVVGGVSSLAGAVIGTIAVSAVSEGLLRIETGFNIAGGHIKAPSGLQETGLALFLLIALLFRPNGITGGNEIAWPWRRVVKPPRAGSLS